MPDDTRTGALISNYSPRQDYDDGTMVPDTLFWNVQGRDVLKDAMMQKLRYVRKRGDNNFSHVPGWQLGRNMKDPSAFIGGTSVNIWLASRPRYHDKVRAGMSWSCGNQLISLQSALWLKLTWTIKDGRGVIEAWAGDVMGGSRYGAQKEQDR